MLVASLRFDTGLPIGRGAAGEVFKVWDPRLERHVALKVLHRRDAGEAARLLAEARAQARVEHPNVCRVYETGERDGRPYILLQFVDGEPIDRVAPQVGLEERVRLIAVVAEAVAAAHAAGLVHRDLKPANILVERRDDGELVPFVLDFGLAVEVAAPTGGPDGGPIGGETGQVLGTPGYLSPEQARGDVRRIDRRSDVFGLGAVLYEVLVGCAPFAADSPVESLVKVLEQEPVPPRRLVPSLPRDLETIALVCLAKEPERRYASAREVALDLRRWLAGEPIQARSASLVRRLAGKARRNPAAATALLVAALALAGGVAATLGATWRGAERARLSQSFAARAAPRPPAAPARRASRAGAGGSGDCPSARRRRPTRARRSTTASARPRRQRSSSSAARFANGREMSMPPTTSRTRTSCAR